MWNFATGQWTIRYGDSLIVLNTLLDYKGSKQKGEVQKMSQKSEITLNLLEKLIETAVKNALIESGCGTEEASGIPDTLTEILENIKIGFSIWLSLSKYMNYLTSRFIRPCELVETNHEGSLNWDVM